MAAKQAVLNNVSTVAANDPGKALRVLPSYFSDPDAEDFNRLLYERVRLGIMSALLVNRSMSFSELKSLLNASDGNLSVHARKLEDAGYISCQKSFVGRMPKTEYSLTRKGRKTFKRYLDHMEALIHLARSK